METWAWIIIIILVIVAVIAIVALFLSIFYNVKGPAGPQGAPGPPGPPGEVIYPVADINFSTINGNQAIIDAINGFYTVRNPTASSSILISKFAYQVGSSIVLTSAGTWSVASVSILAEPGLSFSGVASGNVVLMAGSTLTLIVGADNVLYVVS